MGKFSRAAMAEVADRFGVFARELAIDVDQRVVLKTPVDTGRARSNWLVGLVRARRGTRRTIDQSGGNTILQNTREISKAGNFVDVWLSNNLPYISELENGSSKQAPAGMARLSVMESVRVFRNRRI